MSEVENQAAKVAIGLSGQVGTKGIFLIDDDKIVTSTNMINGAYVVAAQPTAPCILSVLATAGDTADTMGTVTFVGTDISGVAITEVVIPIAGTTVYTTKEFATVTSITGAAWAIDAVEATNDTIKIGVYSAYAGEGYYFAAIQVVAQAVVAAQTDKSGAVTAQLSDFTALPVGVYPTKVTHIALTSGEAIGILARV